MIVLDKITFGYSPEEDRISLSSQSCSGERLLLWLTYRLVRQLIPHLSQLAVADIANPDESAVDEGKDDNRPESGITETAVECSADSPAFLVSEIDLAQRDNKLVMSFRGDALGEPAVLGLSGEAANKIVEALKTFSDKAGWRITDNRADTPVSTTKIGRNITLH